MMNKPINHQKPIITNKYLFYMSIWFFGLSLSLVLLPMPIGQLFGGLSTDWVSFSIILIGMIAPLIYLAVLSMRKKLKPIILLPIFFYDAFTIVLTMINIGRGWGGVVMLIGSILQGAALIWVLLYGLLFLFREKKYELFTQLMVIVFLNFGFMIDAVIIFYPEAYQTLPLYSLISYVLSWVLIHIGFYLSRQNFESRKV